MKIYIYFVTLLVIGVLVSCNQRSKPSSLDNSNSADSLKQVLVSETSQYYTDMSSRDWKAYSSHFWPGSHLTTVWQQPGEDTLSVVMTTIEEFVEQADEGPGSQPVFEENMLDAKVQVYNNLATVWATYAAKFGTQDSLMEWQGIDAFTYMKHDGEWHIVSLAYTNMEDSHPE